jgi:erythromycin esterase-like protein
MRTAISPELADTVRAAAQPLTGAAHDYDLLLDRVGDRRLVLLGEASYGTREFYQARADITRRLIAEKWFTAVAVEADWPDAYRVNGYVRGLDHDASAEEALGGFRRFPAATRRRSTRSASRASCSLGATTTRRRWRCSARGGSASGVIYRPETERQSHYFAARLSEQFDAVLHFDTTSAVEPLERTAGGESGEVPETFPTAV